MPTGGAFEPGPPHGDIQLFNVFLDPNERREVADDHPEIVAELLAMADEYRRAGYTPALFNRVAADPASDPKFHNGTWVPYRNSSRTPEAQAINVNGGKKLG